MQCAICKAESPAAKIFCGDCGAPLDPVMAHVRSYVESDLKKKIDSALHDRFGDKNAVEIETTEKIAARLTGWAKIFGTVVGIPLGILTVVLAILGVKTFNDLTTLARGAEDSIKGKMSEVHQQADVFRSERDQLTKSMTEMRTQLAKESAELQAQLTLVKAGEAEIKSKVDAIEKKILRFEPSSALTPELQRKLDQSVDAYRRYLEGIGFKLPMGKVTVKVDPELKDNSYFQPEENRLVLGPIWAQDPDVVFREFTHFALSEAAGGTGGVFGHLDAVESGIADYFACSYSNDPELGKTGIALYNKMYKHPISDKPYFRNLKNDRKFSDLKPDEELHHVGETLGGALWEIRREVKKPTADRLILAAWISINKPGPAGDQMETYARALLQASLATDSGKHAPVIRTVFESRGLKLPPGVP